MLILAQNEKLTNCILLQLHFVTIAIFFSLAGGRARGQHFVHACQRGDGRYERTHRISVRERGRILAKAS